MLAVCLLASSTALAADGECKVGDLCTLRGVLQIFRSPPATTAVLTNGDVCTPVALSTEVLANYKRWDRKTVTIVGVAYSHSAAEEMISYELKGRTVIASICRSSPIVLFVTDIRAK